MPPQEVTMPWYARARTALRKAKRISGMLQGTMGLEGQALDRQSLWMMTKRTAREILSAEAPVIADRLPRRDHATTDEERAKMTITIAIDGHDVPDELVRLEAAIYESLPAAEARALRSRFWDALNPAADFSLIWHRFAVWLLSSDDLGLPRIAGRGGKLALAKVVVLHLRVIDGDYPSPEEWFAAEAAARSAAMSAEWPAARSADLVAIMSAEWMTCDSFAKEAVRSAARAVARAGTDSDQWLVVGSASYLRMADRLLALMAEASLAPAK